MTESDWMQSADLAAMLAYMQAPHARSGIGGHILVRTVPVSDRKFRLFACACCRQIWDRLTDPRSLRAVEVAEAYADGEAIEQERAAARIKAARVAVEGGFAGDLGAAISAS